MQSVLHKKGEKGAFLGGAFPNVNHGLAFGQGPLSKELFIVGDFLVIDPASPLRFDEEITLKEDYDLTAQVSERVRACEGRSQTFNDFSFTRPPAASRRLPPHPVASRRLSHVLPRLQTPRKFTT